MRMSKEKIHLGCKSISLVVTEGMLSPNGRGRRGDGSGDGAAWHPLLLATGLANG